jgi:hypothetical protein
MKRSSPFLPVGLSLFALAALPAHAQLTLNQIGGSIGAGNYGTLGTTSAFAFDLLGNGSFAPTHTIPNVNNGTFGNSSSWIGNSANSFVGLNFGAVPVPVGQVAWGRDNTPGGLFDRTAGQFTLNYTQVANPGAGLAVTGNPATGWASLGSVNYISSGILNSPVSMSLRHLWSFPSVNATGIRLTAPGNGIGDGSAVDELEAYAPAAAPLTLVTTGGTMNAATNIALGKTAFAKDVFAGGSNPSHTIPHINDGIYGNANSWIGSTEGSFAGVNLGGSFSVNHVAFGRDNLAPAVNEFNDRTQGAYVLQYTNAANPGAATPDASWNTIGAVYYDHNGDDTADRHDYSFAPVSATGFRILTPNGNAIDELEVYAVPEAGVTSFLVLAGATLLRRRRVVR